MAHFAKTIRRTVLAAAAVFGVGVGYTRAATFTADLALAPAASQYGEYLTASYDFGVRLADVHSVRLELNIPGGYEGTAATTGNSSWYYYLLMQIHDPADQPPMDYLANNFTAAPLHVPPSAAAEVRFIRPQIGVGWQVFDAPWPEFLLSGAGSVSFVDVHTHSWHPLPDAVGGYTTTWWLIPEEVLGARLIIEGTAIPEPAAWSVLGAALPGLCTVARRK